MLIPIWAVALIVFFFLLVIAGIFGWLQGDDGGSYFCDGETRSLGCLLAMIPVLLIGLLIAAVWGWLT